MNSAYQYIDSPIIVNAPNVTYTDDTITADYVYHTSEAKMEEGKVVITPQDEKYVFKTDRRIPKVGMMLIGWGGNNGTTVTLVFWLTSTISRGIRRRAYNTLTTMVRFLRVRQ